MEQKSEDRILTEEIIKKVESDLKRYPDWIIKLEADGLGVPSRKIPIGGCAYSFGSIVESMAELENDIEKKVFIIEKVYDRLHGRMKEIIELKYFRDYSRKDVLRQLNLNKYNYYLLRDRALECFARALGYIE
jgi:hypothetical protein